MAVRAQEMRRQMADACNAAAQAQQQAEGARVEQQVPVVCHDFDFVGYRLLLCGRWDRQASGPSMASSGIGTGLDSRSPEFLKVSCVYVGTCRTCSRPWSRRTRT